MSSKDKKIVDRYMAKHPTATPEKIEEYARKKGIHITVMPEVEHRKLQQQICDDLSLPNDLDMSLEENQLRVQEAVESLSPEKKAEYSKKAK